MFRTRAQFLELETVEKSCMSTFQSTVTAAESSFAKQIPIQFIRKRGNGVGPGAGLPDFSGYKIPKREKHTKLRRSIPNVHKI
jgi:hypothetical protein